MMPEGVFDDAVGFDTTDAVFYANTNFRNTLVLVFLLIRQLSTSGFLFELFGAREVDPVLGTGSS